MSDLVEQLRMACSWCSECQECKAVMHVAADEIERLRAACLAAYRAWVQEAGSSQFVKDEAAHLLIDVVRPKKGRAIVSEGGDS